ncbi:MAG: hypothetical protein K2Q06_16520 [Parvularculaceae bacterium]|nr:hypothetical protein [Parvularculaceae bacterium]
MARVKADSEPSGANRNAAESVATREPEERALRRRYQIRQVTDYQASWTQAERGGSGVFTVQLILDRRVDEYILDVNVEDLDVLLTLLAKSDHTMFDLERKVLMFENLSAS